MIDGRTPVIVGTGQVTQRIDDGEPVLEPVDLVVEATRRAVQDAGSSSLLGAIQSVRLLNIHSWSYRNASLLAAQRLGITPGHYANGLPGGHQAQGLLGAAAWEIAAGLLDVVLLGGAEAKHSLISAYKAGGKVEWTLQASDVLEPETIGYELPLSHEEEERRDVIAPLEVYALFEQAQRRQARRSVEEHRRDLAELMAGFSAVAVSNPYAWHREPWSAEQIRTPSPGNRLVNHPYTKMMNAEDRVDQGSALIMCSVERARALGIHTDLWVFPHVIISSANTCPLMTRPDLANSPAMFRCGRVLREIARIAPEEVAHVEVYSCFPSAVQAIARALDLSLQRPLTVHGGLRFAGGPGNNYLGMALNSMVHMLRQDDETHGLCAGNGGYLREHTLGLYGARPAAEGFRSLSVQGEVSVAEPIVVDSEPNGRATVETYTVMYRADGGTGAPSKAIVVGRMADGRRALGVSTDTELMTSLATEEWLDRTIQFIPDGRIDAA